MTTNISATNFTNPYTMTMANDYFGSQVFGANPFGAQPQYSFEGAPNDVASALVQQYAYSTGGTAPTMQDYAMATQIADMYSNPNMAMISPYTSFTQSDIFAQQAMPFMFNNGQAFA